MNINNISNQDLSNMTGIHRTAISRFRNGIRIPSLIDAVKIEEATEGEVPMESFRPDKKDE